MRSAPAGAAAAFRGEAVLIRSPRRPLRIAPQFCGPADRSNGGYFAGRLAELLDGDWQLTFRAPVPLETDLELRDVDGAVHVHAGGNLLAEAVPTTLELEPPQPPGWEEAAEATQRYIARQQHPFPRCFVCGTHRSPGDGLRIYAGPVEGRPLVASPWAPHAAFAAGDGPIGAEFVWAALDCPGCFASYLDRPPGPAVLGRIAGTVSGRPEPGERCVVYGWSLGHDGRKHHVGTAIVGDSGRLLGMARATWIDVPYGDAGTGTPAAGPRGPRP